MGHSSLLDWAAQAVLDHAPQGARLVFSCGWHITRDGKDVYSWKLKTFVKVFGWLARVTRFADLDDPVEACRRIFASDARWTVVRGSDLEEGDSQGLPVWSRHVGDPILVSNRTRRVDFALFMVDALTADEFRDTAGVIALVTHEKNFPTYLAQRPRDKRPERSAPRSFVRVRHVSLQVERCTLSLTTVLDSNHPKRMKSLHRPDLFAWSAFNEERNIDFNAVLWRRPEGNILIDPLPLTDHDRRHLEDLGGAKSIILTNSDHIRAAGDLRENLGAEVIGPVGESDSFPFPCDRWAFHNEEIVPGLLAIELQGSKTAGELALLLEHTTLITGDLIRAHRAGTLMLLPDPKLADKAQAIASVRALLRFDKIEAVAVGDGWSIFSNGYATLERLVQSFG